MFPGAGRPPLALDRAALCLFELDECLASATETADTFLNATMLFLFGLCYGYGTRGARHVISGCAPLAPVAHVFEDARRHVLLPVDTPVALPKLQSINNVT